MREGTPAYYKLYIQAMIFLFSAGDKQSFGVSENQLFREGIEYFTQGYALCILVVMIGFGESMHAQTFIPGNTYYDSTGFVEYRAGNLPIVISAPHGGSLEPDSILDRDCTNCVYLQDRWTQQISEGVYDTIVAQTGCYPHVIINLLHRIKFDANRDVGDAADGNATVEQAWRGYHQLVDSAKVKVERDYGRGLFLDMHAHGHPNQRIEVGYLLTAEELRQSDSTLNSPSLNDESSLRTLVIDNIQGLQHAELIRGEYSMGSLLTDAGFPAVPSTDDPFPLADERYFIGGYNTRRHGSRDNGGHIDAIQLELNQDIRATDSIRQVLVDAIATSTLEYVDLHYNDAFGEEYCGLLVDSEDTDAEVPNFKVYPNPAHQQIFIEGSIDRLDIEIYNAMGQRVLSETWMGQTVSITHLPDGWYTIQLRTEDISVISKLLITK